MKIIEPYVEVYPFDGKQIAKNLERYARTAYKSEGAITEESYKVFLCRIIKSGHTSTLEHEKVTVKFVVDCIKKILYHGHDLDLNRDKLKIELGDLMWYVATLATTAGLLLEEIAVANIEKLKTRYPEGFSEERSNHREDNT